MTGFGQLLGTGGAAQADQTDQIWWVREWWDLGPLVWAIAAAAVVAWLVLVRVMSRRLGPRRVRAGVGELDLPGDEPPALVSLLTSRWKLDRSAVPATLLDLAARGEVSIRLEGTETVVHVPEERALTGEVERLAPYEARVRDHVQALAERTDHRTVPVGALTTGSRSHSRGWWVRFRRAVKTDAKERGLARKRWSARHKLAVFVASLVPAAALGFALATAVYDLSEEDGSTTQASQESDSYLIYAGLVYGGLALIGFAIAAGTRSGVTDTDEGREQAARWLAWRETVAKDPLFKDHTAARVDLWGRKLSYGAAVGIADGAVRDLPMGAESQRRLWSSVGGTWREVRVRRPLLGGIHPGSALIFGAGMAAFLFLLPLLVLQELPLAGSTSSEDLLAAAPFVVLGGGGLATFVVALLSVVLPRREVAGQVLAIRKREWRSDRWQVVTDDGTSRRLRAWWTDSRPKFGVDAVVRTRISRLLRHAGEVHVEGRDQPEADDDADDGRIDHPILGATTSAEMHVRPVTQQVLKLTATTGGVERPAQLPKLPGAAALSEVLGRTVELHVDASLHDAIESGETATYELGEGLVYATWTNSAVFKKMRRPRLLTREVEGVGEDAYRLRVGRTLLARQGAAVLMVAVHLPGENRERDKVSAALARHCLDESRREQPPLMP